MQLPKKHLIGNLAKDIVESRRVMLETFLEDILIKPDICHSSEFVIFLQPSDNYKEAATSKGKVTKLQQPEHLKKREQERKLKKKAEKTTKRRNTLTSSQKGFQLPPDLGIEFVHNGSTPSIIRPTDSPQPQFKKSTAAEENKLLNLKLLETRTLFKRKQAGSSNTNAEPPKQTSQLPPRDRSSSSAGTPFVLPPIPTHHAPLRSVNKLSNSVDTNSVPLPASHKPPIVPPRRGGSTIAGINAPIVNPADLKKPSPKFPPPNI